MANFVQHIIGKFRRDENGAVLVEFAIVLPLMLLFFAVTVESGRMFWAYQQTVSGVRDASRFFGRAAPFDICTTGTAGWPAVLADFVENRYRAQDAGTATSVFGGSVSLATTNPVVVTINCIDDDGQDGRSDIYDADMVVIGTVTANLEISLPFAGPLAFFGVPASQVSAAVSDQVRIYGQ